ncbi:hypothetical protein IJ182_09575 [bacterium]|nr:hypothetical protein [bacterium]
MSMFKKLAEKLGIPQNEEIDENETVFSSEKSQHDQIIAERSEIKESITATLKRIGFTESEIEEVLFILADTELQIKNINEDLVGTNINYQGDDPNDILKARVNEIHKLEIKASEKIRKKIAEIIERKRNS